MFSNAPPETHKKLRQRKAEVDIAAGDDDFVMVIFLALTLVEDPTLGTAASFFRLAGVQLPRSYPHPLDIIFILIYPYSLNNYHTLIDEKLLCLCNYASPPNDVTSSTYLQVLSFIRHKTTLSLASRQRYCSFLVRS